MIRILAVLCIVSCVTVSTAPAVASSPASSSSELSQVKDLRQTAYELWHQGEYDKAADCYHDVLQNEQFSQPADFANDLHSIAVISADLGQYEVAKSYLHRELDVLQQTGNKNAIASAYKSLAGIFQIEGAFPEAETNYKNALAMFNEAGGGTDANTANTLNGMGWLYTLWGKDRLANEYIEKADESAKKAFPQDAPELIRFLDVRASFLSGTGKYSEAEKSWQQALRIGEKAYAKNDEKYDEVFLHLGQMQSILGEYKSAEEMLERFLAVKKRLAGSDISIRAVATAELGRMYTEQHRFGDAEPLFATSVQMIDSQARKVPVANSLIRTYFGDYYMARSKWPEAEKQYRAALQLRETMLGQNAPDVALSMFALSKALTKQHKKKEAEEYRSRAEAIVASGKDAILSGDTIDVRAFRQTFK